MILRAGPSVYRAPVLFGEPLGDLVSCRTSSLYYTTSDNTHQVEHVLEWFPSAGFKRFAKDARPCRRWFARVREGIMPSLTPGFMGWPIQRQQCLRPLNRVRFAVSSSGSLRSIGIQYSCCVVNRGMKVGRNWPNCTLRTDRSRCLT